MFSVLRSKMNELFEDFATAHELQNGYSVAQTISPVPPPNQPQRLKKIWQSTNSHSAKRDIKHFIQQHTSRRKSLDDDEISGWVDVYAAYWNATGEIVAGENGNVCNDARPLPDSGMFADISPKSSWTKVYEAWRDLTSMLIRGYNNCGFEAWTIPCLYMVGKYLRLFAIKSDEERRRSSTEPSGAATLMQDDFDPELDTQGQLTDCEQHLKRMFTLCLNDRFVFYYGKVLQRTNRNAIGPLLRSRENGVYTS